MPPRYLALLVVALSGLLAAFWLRPSSQVVAYDDLVWKNDLYLHQAQPFTGTALAQHPNGQPKGEYPFQQGRFHGVVREWWENGTQSVETHFVKGKRHGSNRYWDQQGRLTKEQRYDQDHSVSEQHFSHEP